MLKGKYTDAMKGTLFIISSAAVLAMMAACAPQADVGDRADRNRYPVAGDGSADAAPTPTPAPAETFEDDAQFVEFPTPTPTPTPATAAGTDRDLPYGTPVPGMRGYVTSPYDPTAGYVDIRGFVPGQVVPCPFVPGKFFLAP